MINLVFSKADPASVNMRRYFQDKVLDNTQIVNCESMLDYFEQDKRIELDLFLSKHASKKNVRSLSCHSTGNYGSAVYGGKDKTLSISNALVQSECYRRLAKLNEEKHLGFEAALEVTHHGPSNSAASLFLEVGSSENDWSDTNTCSIVAELAERLVHDYKAIMNVKKMVCFGLGGPHYAPIFSRKLLSDNSLAIGHICPSYALIDLDYSMFKQMIEKTTPKPSIVILAYKGIDKDKREKILEWSKIEGLEVIKLR